jgi:hypothetical protein
MEPEVRFRKGRTVDEKTKHCDVTRKVRKAYEAPTMRSEKMFESNALACGKCTSGPASQYQCGTVMMNS